MALQDHSDGALQSPDLAAFRQEGKKEQSEEAVESCSWRKHWIMPSTGTLLTGPGWHPGVAVTSGRAISEEVGFPWGKRPAKQLLNPAKPGPAV